MADNSNFGFGKFVPGFDFLQNIAKGASQSLPQMPNLASWVAPTLNVEELDKRISELKAVHFWLDQNSKALAATIQALEVQKMTLATLKGMNVNMSEMAEAFKLPVAGSAVGASAETPAAPPAHKPQPASKKVAPDAAKAAANAIVDPLQWWGSLTQQFQQIASNAMNDAAVQTASLRKAAGASTKAAGAPAKSAKSPAARRTRKAR